MQGNYILRLLRQWRKAEIWTSCVVKKSLNSQKIFMKEISIKSNSIKKLLHYLLQYNFKLSLNKVIHLQICINMRNFHRCVSHKHTHIINKNIREIYQNNTRKSWAICGFVIVDEVSGLNDVTDLIVLSVLINR